MSPLTRYICSIPLPHIEIAPNPLLCRASSTPHWLDVHLVLVHGRVLNINHRTIIACASAPKARPARPCPKSWIARPKPWTARPLLLLLLLPPLSLLLLRLRKGAEEWILLRLPLCLTLPCLR